MLGTNGHWPAIGEIDILEHMGHSPQLASGAAHDGRAAPGRRPTAKPGADPPARPSTTTKLLWDARDGLTLGWMACRSGTTRGRADPAGGLRRAAVPDPGTWRSAATWAAGGRRHLPGDFRGGPRGSTSPRAERSGCSSSSCPAARVAASWPGPPGAGAAAGWSALIEQAQAAAPATNQGSLRDAAISSCWMQENRSFDHPFGALQRRARLC